jgi:ribonuclease T
MKHYMILDTETGGLNPKENPVLEIAAAVYNEDAVAKEFFYASFEPYLPMDSKALAINGFYERWQKPDSANHNQYEIEKLMRWSSLVLKKYNPVLVGQNLKFDLEFIDSLTENFNIRGWSKMWNYHTLDTSQIAYILKEAGLLETEKFNLAALAKAYGIQNRAAHTATADVETTAGVFFSMLKQLQKIRDGQRNHP